MGKAKAEAGDKKKPVDLAARLADPAFRAEIEDGIRTMAPDKAAELVRMLEVSLRRRKIELYGYLAAAAMMLVGMVIALYIYGASDPGEFVAWIFLLPLGLAGLVMMLVGRWARGGKKPATAPTPDV